MGLFRKRIENDPAAFAAVERRKDVLAEEAKQERLRQVVSEGLKTLLTKDFPGAFLSNSYASYLPPTDDGETRGTFVAAAEYAGVLLEMEGSVSFSALDLEKAIDQDILLILCNFKIGEQKVGAASLGHATGDFSPRNYYKWEEGHIPIPRVDFLELMAEAIERGRPARDALRERYGIKPSLSPVDQTPNLSDSPFETPPMEEIEKPLRSIFRRHSPAPPDDEIAAGE